LLNNYIDSLKENYSVKIIQRIKTNEYELKNIYAHKRGNIKAKNIVYVSFDFNCYACKESEVTLKKYLYPLMYHHSLNLNKKGNEFCYKTNRRYFGFNLLERLMDAAIEDTWYGKFRYN